MSQLPLPPIRTFFIIKSLALLALCQLFSDDDKPLFETQPLEGSVGSGARVKHGK